MRHYAVVAAILAFYLWGAHVPLHAAEKPQTTAAASYTGGVVDPAGQPAAGCRAYLVNAGPPWKLEVIEEAVSGADGSFTLRTPRPWSPDISGRQLSLFVRDAKGRIGFPDWSQPNAIAEQGGRFRLVEVGAVHGRLVDGAGLPLADIEVRPAVLAAAEFGKPGVWRTSLPQVVRSKMIAKTGTDGAFVLWGLPKKGTILLKIAGGEYGHLDAFLAPGKPVTIALDRVAKVSGTVTCPVSTAAEGLKLRLVPADGDPYQGRDYRLVFEHTITTEKGGQFRNANVIPGKYRLELDLRDRKGYHMDSSPLVEVRPGATVEHLTIALRPDFQVKGSVVDAETRAGVKGVEVYLYQSSGEERRWTMQGRARTDEKGLFVASAKPGRILVSIGGVPDGYVRPSTMRFDGEPPEVTKDTTLPPLRLERAIPIEGLVVEGAGKPVVGAEVYASMVRNQSGAPVSVFAPDGGRQKTDSQGRFRVKGVPADAEVSIRVRSEAGVTDGPVSINPKKPVRLVLSPQHAFALRGQVIGRSGKPIRWANVRLMFQGSDGQSRFLYPVETTSSDVKGVFTFRNLWPGDEYQALIEVDGYERVQTPLVAGEAGKEHDLGRISPVSNPAGASGAPLRPAQVGPPR